MKVSLEVLQRVYDAFQEGNEAGESDFLDLDSHLHFIDAFEMPLWNWSTERSAFERYAQNVLIRYRCKLIMLQGSYSADCLWLRRVTRCSRSQSPKHH